MKKYTVAIIDDDPDVNSFFDVVKDELLRNEINIEYEIIGEAKESKFELSKPFDVVIFDCKLNGSNFVSYERDGERAGYSLIKEFRKNNKRTNIIFYSSTFDIENSDLPFTQKELIHIINNLKIFQIIERDIKQVINTVSKAVREIDPVLSIFDEIFDKYGEEDIQYKFKDSNISAVDLLHQLKMGGEAADDFRSNIIQATMTNMLKFKNFE